MDGVSGGGNIPEIPTNPVTDGSETGGDVCGSLDEWLQPLPSSQDLEVSMFFSLFILFSISFSK